MDKNTYFKQLSRQVRWRLPKAEADEVLADYQDILAHAEDPAQLDAPGKAARLVAEPGAYRRWLGMFLGLVCCLLLPETVLFQTGCSPATLALALAALGAGLAVCLVWNFRRRRAERAPLPRGLAPALMGMLTVSLLAGAAAASIIAGVWTALPMQQWGQVLRTILCALGTAAVVMGLLGLVNARMIDRRWSAVYALAATVLACALLTLAPLSALSVMDNAWLETTTLRVAAAGAVGLVGTGACLC